MVPIEFLKIRSNFVQHNFLLITAIIIAAGIGMNGMVFAQEDNSSTEPAKQFNNEKFCPTSLALEKDKLYVIYSEINSTNEGQHFYQTIDAATVKMNAPIPIQLPENIYLPSMFTVLNGNFFLAGDGTIIKYVPATQQFTTLLDLDSVPKIGNAEIDYFHPDAITNDGKNLYFTVDSEVHKFDIENTVLSVFAGESGGSTFRREDGIGTDASFSDEAKGIATDGTNLYVNDLLSIRKLNIKTRIVSTLTEGVYAAPSSRYITTDGKNLYASEDEFDYINKIDLKAGKKAKTTTIAGRENFAKWVDGVGTKARFNTPTSIATDGKHLFIVDSGNCALRTLNLSNYDVKTIYKGNSNP